LDLLKFHGSERWLINQGQTVVIINGGQGLMGGTPLGAIQTDDFYKDFN
jgi:hypothetical protein